MKSKTESTAASLTVIGVDIGKALLVDNADRGRLLRYVQPNIMRHRNLRWCKSPGNMPGSRHYRCLRLRTAITRGPHHQDGSRCLLRSEILHGEGFANRRPPDRR